MSLSQKGFTLTELLVTIGIFSVLVAIAIPNIYKMMDTAQYKEAARGIASTLQDARSRSVARNLEHRVVFEVAQNRYRLEQGNRSTNSTTWTPVFGSWTDFRPGVRILGTTSCSSNANRSIQFNPNGTAQSEYICVMDEKLVEKFKVGVTSASTGRVSIQ